MKKIISLLMCCAIVLSLAGCKKFDDGKEEKTNKKTSSTSTTSKPSAYQDITIPEIKSDDSVMPAYVDISIYDEENYADVYLGDDFKYDVKYDGMEIKVPTTYDEFVSQGWTLVPSDSYNENSQVLVGRSLKIDFVNNNNKKITAVFYNNGRTSTTIKNCPIVKFIVKENVVIKKESDYGEFNVNGINNTLAITDVIQILGAPSHFYNVSEEIYYLDWFITKKDRRSEITIYVDTAEDHICAIEFAYY